MRRHAHGLGAAICHSLVVQVGLPQRSETEQHAAARAIGGALSQMEERTSGQLQKIDAKAQVRTQQLAALQQKVERVADGARDKYLDGWTASLAVPLEPPLASARAAPLADVFAGS